MRRNTAAARRIDDTLDLYKALTEWNAYPIQSAKSVGIKQLRRTYTADVEPIGNGITHAFEKARDVTANQIEETLSMALARSTSTNTETLTS
jgi:hypothetical protein